MNDVPVPADYDGDGIRDIAVWRPGDGTWYIQLSSNGAIVSIPWGTVGDRPFPGDYDGDGKADLAVWRPGEGMWYIQTSSEIRVTGFGNLRLADYADGSKNYRFQIQVTNPDGSTLTNKSLIQDVKVYDHVYILEATQPSPWFLWYDRNMYFDSNGTDPAPPYPLPWSEINGYLDLFIGPRFYKGVVTDVSGNTHVVWLFYQAPTEVSKVQGASMGVTNNPDGTVTLSWTNPPELDPAKHIIRVYVNSTVDVSGDGYNDTLLTAHLPTTANSYTIPSAEVSRLKGFTGLYWYVQIRQRANNVFNPDATTKNYEIYRNYGQTQALVLP